MTYFKVALSRTHRDGGDLKSTASLGREDLPIDALLQQAWSAIVTAEATPEK